MLSAGDICPKPGTHDSCGSLRRYIREIDQTPLLTITEGGALAGAQPPRGSGLCGV